ncbi:MAG: hypothetical protein EB072_12075 [Betaproteobacteria bacterium]|nr:hypothetical protein [Betaproteobacteria bacterium]
MVFAFNIKSPGVSWPTATAQRGAAFVFFVKVSTGRGGLFSQPPRDRSGGRPYAEHAQVHLQVGYTAVESGARNAANDDDGKSPNSMLPAEMTWFWGEDMDLLADAEARHALMAALAHMSGDQRYLMDLLANHRDLAAAAKACGVPSATFYRRVADLQMHLRMFGIRPAA